MLGKVFEHRKSWNSSKKNGLNLLFFSKTDLWDSHTFLSMYSTIRIIIRGSVNIQTSHGSVMGIATLFISLAQMQYLPTFTINSIHSSIHKYSSPIRRIWACYTTHFLYIFFFWYHIKISRISRIYHQRSQDHPGSTNGLGCHRRKKVNVFRDDIRVALAPGAETSRDSLAAHHFRVSAVEGAVGVFPR